MSEQRYQRMLEKAREERKDLAEKLRTAELERDDARRQLSGLQATSVDITQHQAQLQSRDTAVTMVTTDLADARGEAARLRKSLHTVEERNKGLVLERDSFKDECEALEVRRRETAADRDALQKRLDTEGVDKLQRRLREKAEEIKAGEAKRLGLQAQLSDLQKRLQQSMARSNWLRTLVSAEVYNQAEAKLLSLQAMVKEKEVRHG